FTISGTGKQVRDVLHADDLVSLYRAAYEHKNESAGEIFNIGGGINNSLSLLELFSVLEQKLGLQVPLNFNRLSRRQSDQDYFVADISKAARLLKWQPGVTTSVGLDRMLAWVGRNSK
ncbi:MAG: GDP-mannose 4,6-dehydratase, partial [Opitutus sp.]|nr:GDP-mannose 4,6-dehydratase [Opitutus sp.]